MKYTIILIGFILILTGCHQNKTIEKNEEGQVDTLIQKNMYNFTLGEDVNKKSDTFIKGKVKNIIDKIDNMNGEIKTLKTENHELKTIISDTGSAGRPFIILPISDDQKDWK